MRFAWADDTVDHALNIPIRLHTFIVVGLLLSYVLLKNAVHNNFPLSKRALQIPVHTSN